MPELNRAERKALVLAAALLTAGAIVREAWAPGAAVWSWRSPSTGDLTAVRAGVAEGVATEAEAERPLGPGERIDPNTASEAQLRRLPGIGPSRARAIIELRKSGRFRVAEDLLPVPGIGEVILARVAPHLDLAGPASSPDPAPGPARSAAPVESRSRACTGLDLNRAGVEALETLPYVGPARAREIVKLRRERRGFRSVDELIEVSGIGPYVLEALRPHLCVR